MKKIRPLSALTLTMINIAAIGSVKNWPLTAEFGFTAISYILLALICFFLPTAFVTAELSTALPRAGGIYAWIKMAFGHRLGFLGIWLFWLLNVIWYPTILSFIAATTAYLFNSELLHNRAFTIPLIMGSFWLATFINLRGMKISGWISSLGAACGTFIPALLIIFLGVAWWLSSKQSHLDASLTQILPSFSSWHELAFFAGVMLSFTGIEMSAIHAKNVENPKKSYFRSTLASTALLAILTILGVLAIATVVPIGELSLVAGTMQAFAIFLPNNSWVLQAIAICMILGAFGSLSSWMMGAANGLLAAASHGDLPPYFRSVNKNGVPARLLLWQAVIVTVLSLLFVFMPSLSASFWIFSALVTQLYLIIYILLFATVIKLRKSHPDLPRPYSIPGGMIGLALCTGLGVLSSVFAICIGFIPPPELQAFSLLIYTGSLVAVVALSCLLPSIILLFQKPSWKKQLPHEESSS